MGLVRGNIHFVLKVWQDLSYSLICDLCILKLNLTSQFFGVLFFALLSVKNLRVSLEPLTAYFSIVVCLLDDF